MSTFNKNGTLKEGYLPILHYFLYRLPSTFSFEFLYNPYNPLRFAVETFDSIEIIKQELCKKK